MSVWRKASGNADRDNGCMATPIVLRASEAALLARAPRIAVIMPCHNEAVTRGKVVADFRAARYISAFQ